MSITLIGRIGRIAIFLAPMFLLSCAANPITGRTQLKLVSEQTAIAKSTSAYLSLIGGLSKSGKLSNDKALVGRVKGITDRLITQAVVYRPDSRNWNWSINVIDDPEQVNAFCMAGGKMAVYTGLVEKLEPTDDELAEVMGHEISHAIAGHAAEQMSVQAAAGIAVEVATAMASPQKRQAAHDLSSIAAIALISLPNSREAEAEADRIGVELAAKAGYDPHAAVTLWQKMLRVSGSTSRFDFLSTHPASVKRIEALSALEAGMQEIYEVAKDQRDTDPVSWAVVTENRSLPDGRWPASTAGSADALVGSSTTAKRLRDIQGLRKDGLISEQEFQEKKRQLLMDY